MVLEVAPQYWQRPQGLKYIYLRTSNNGVVPLDAVTEAQTGTTPLTVNHTGLFPSVTVSFNLAPGTSLSDAAQAINGMQQNLGTPPTIRGFFSGTLLAYQQSLSSEPYLILTALLAVYIVLGILYESLVHPLTIISTLPSASAGAMLDIPWLLRHLRAAGRNPNAILELWPAPESSVDATINKEEEWARTSVQFLRTLIPD